MKSYKGIIINLLIIIILAACAGHRNTKFSRSINGSIENPIFENHFKGILIFDPASRDTLFKRNSSKYFTPASNTKIFTLFAALKLLPDSLPALRYAYHNDTLYITGTADGTQLHPFFRDSTSIKFMGKFDNISLSEAYFEDEKFGPGWSWDDYHWYYSAERSAMPLYGNLVTVMNYPEPGVSPGIFTDSVSRITYTRNRAPDKNLFYIDPARKDTLEIPFIGNLLLTKKLLELALGKRLYLSKGFPAADSKLLPGTPADTVYQRMMQLSDNFLAEQLLIQASTAISDTLSGRRTRQYVLDSLLPGLRQQPRWVDGSGLSRYNLFSPEAIVYVLDKMYNEIPRDRLLSFFAVGGISGTLEAWYPGNPDPYIYAKTGTLGNNHCVSGFLITKSGKTLIFSFMNNHFRQPTAAIKNQMQQVFEFIRDNY